MGFLRVGREHTPIPRTRGPSFARAAGLLQDLRFMRISVVSDSHDHLANVDPPLALEWAGRRVVGRRR
jgi:hypothetical protein